MSRKRRLKPGQPFSVSIPPSKPKPTHKPAQTVTNPYRPIPTAPSHMAPGQDIPWVYKPPISSAADNLAEWATGIAASTKPGKGGKHQQAKGESRPLKNGGKKPGRPGDGGIAPWRPPSGGGGGGGATGGGGGGGGARPGKGGGKGGGKNKGPGKQRDIVGDQIKALLQHNQGILNFYNQNTEAQRQAAVNDAAMLSAAAGSLSSTVPVTYYANDKLSPEAVSQAEGYNALANATGAATARANAMTNQAVIADSGNALQKLFAGNRDAMQMAAGEYARRVKAEEPTMRMEQADAAAKQGLELAKQKYLYDKMGLDASQFNARLGFDYTKLNADQSYRSQKLQLDAADKQIRNALKGQQMGSAQRKEINAWAKNNLYVKTSATKVDENGVEVAVTQYQPKKDLGLAQIMQQMTQDGGFPPQAAASIAMSMGADVRSMGGWRAFKVLVGYVGKRQALKQIRATFGAQTVKTIQNSDYFKKQFGKKR